MAKKTAEKDSKKDKKKDEKKIIKTSKVEKKPAVKEEKKLKTKEEKKMAIIHTLVNALDTVSFHNKTRYMKIFSETLPNNAYLLAFKRYDSEKENMKKELRNKFNGDIKAYLAYLKNKYQ